MSITGLRQNSTNMSLDLLTVIVDANPCWWGRVMEETGDKDVSDVD